MAMRTIAQATDEVTKLRIEPELERLLPQLTGEEFSQLEKNILADPGRVTLVLWMEKNVLLDGHNRFHICRKHHIKFDTISVSLPNMDAAKLWIIRENRGRRNFTEEQNTYFLGLEHELEKKLEHRPANNGVTLTPLRTRERLAKRNHVGTKTVQRAAKFTNAVDAIAAAAGNEAKVAILGRDVRIGRQQVQQLAEIAKAQPKAAKNIMAQIKTAKPQEANRIVQAAAQQLEKPPVGGNLFPILKTEKRIEKLQLTGGTGYIIRDPNSKPVFNQTNEMVDWASFTWNPVTGCWHACNYCYARAIANDVRMADAYPKQFEPCFHEARLKAPANTPFPKLILRPQDRNVFVCSMADLFGKWVPDEWIVKVFEQVNLFQPWNFLFLTKFPQRLRSVCDDLLRGFPDNAWMGCTVNAQTRVKTAQEAFKGLRAKVRWLSVEPMQERLTFTDMTMFDWLVAGGKSASPFNGTPDGQPEWEWVEHLLEQARAAGLDVFFKENLKALPKEVPWNGKGERKQMHRKDAEAIEAEFGKMLSLDQIRKLLPKLTPEEHAILAEELGS